MDIQAEAEAYFNASKEPKDLNEDRSRLEAFVAKNKGKLIACVTSGGTTVPLEENTVRFLDNFSTGKRGAACAEHLLAKDYAVVFLSRTGSAGPFARTIQDEIAANVDTSFMNHVKINYSGALELNGGNVEKLRNAVLQYHNYVDSQQLLCLSYYSLADYLHKLRLCGQVLGPTQARTMFLLAAAVSDFHVAPEALTQHKIQSRDGPLVLQLDQVPKTLGLLRRDWAPEAFIVSFKLETDLDILLQKANQALDKYGMDLVIANELHTRYSKVYFVSRDGEETVERKNDAEEIEVPMVDALCLEHESFML